MNNKNTIFNEFCENSYEMDLNDPYSDIKFPRINSEIDIVTGEAVFLNANYPLINGIIETAEKEFTSLGSFEHADSETGEAYFCTYAGSMGMAYTTNSNELVVKMFEGTGQVKKIEHEEMEIGIITILMPIIYIALEKNTNLTNANNKFLSELKKSSSENEILEAFQNNVYIISNLFKQTLTNFKSVNIDGDEEELFIQPMKKAELLTIQTHYKEIFGDFEGIESFNSEILID